MRVKLHQKTSGDQFEVVGSFELEATSDGIDILNKDVTVALGEYSETIAGVLCDLIKPAKTQFISSLIAFWLSNTQQTQAQSGSRPT